jgi:molecular chaperone HtpG
MAKGNINVSVENIFPLIKKFLYSDHEIFLRELISNGTDATTKLKHLISIGEAKTELGDAKIEISINKDAKTITIKDQGLGMTADEVEKYINQIAFSGAEEFLEKYKDDKNETGVIGHFGLGFYSAFMVADKVDIFTKSFKNEPAAHWACDGSPEYTLVEHDKSDRGTEIVLHIAEDSLDFLEEAKISGLLTKYNRFNQVPIKFGSKKVNDPDFTPKTTKDKDGKETTEDHKQIEVDDIINNTSPAWTKAPSDLNDDDYTNFYRELYPMQFEESLFHIHLNVDFPFNLTGILFFPKLSPSMDMQKDKIQLYQNQVYVTDNVEGIVPDFLQMLKGVIDSPDIPLNVSRSGLQADGAVKKYLVTLLKK